MFSNNWQNAILPLNTTIKDAIKSLDSSSLKIVLITNEYNKFMGTVTDGDIRRGLLRGLELGSPINDILNQNPVIANPEMNREIIEQLMSSSSINQIPIINDRKQVVGLHLLSKLSNNKARSNIMIIMAGGKGTRLHPKTLNCPKPLLPIKGKPILEHIINNSRANGFEHFVLAINYLGHMIEDYFGNGKKFGVNIEYLREDAPLGTAGAISLLENRPKECFVVINGDVITEIKYDQLIDFHQENKAAATMAVFKYSWQNPFGVVRTKGVEIIDIEEKPVIQSYINAGVYVFESSILNLLHKSEFCDMPELFRRIQLAPQKVVAYPCHESWIDLGTSKDFTNLEKSLEND